MATYSTGDHERIAAAVGQDVRDVIEHKRPFEWAADWYGLDRGLPRDAPPQPRRTPSSKMHAKLVRLAKSARRLLKDLEIKNHEEAADGPGNFDLLEALAAAETTQRRRRD